MDAPKCRLCGNRHWGGCHQESRGGGESNERSNRGAQSKLEGRYYRDQRILSSEQGQIPGQKSRKIPSSQGSADSSSAGKDGSRIMQNLRRIKNRGSSLSGIQKTTGSTVALQETSQRNSLSGLASSPRDTTNAKALSRPRGRPTATDRKSAYETTKPWKKLGISRTTWYRKRKKGWTK